MIREINSDYESRQLAPPPLTPKPADNSSLAAGGGADALSDFARLQAPAP
jgi:hypothetical protein